MLIAISGCNNNIQQETLEGMIANAKSKVEVISVEDAQEEMKFFYGFLIDLFFEYIQIFLIYF